MTRRAHAPTEAPLQSPKNASHFWIILLLSSCADERMMIGHIAVHID